MSEMPTVSVIIPVFRAEKYLDRCINSLLQQSFQNFEIILVDDGSDDNSPQICDEYARENKRISVIHQQNKGVSAARNAGIDAANGEYIAFIDPDDWIHHDYLSILLNSIGETDVCCCGYKKTHENVTDAVEIPGKIACYSGKEAMRRDGCRVYIWAKLYRKSYIDSVRFSIPLRNAQDRAFNAELLAKNPEAKYAVINNRLYYYYQHDDEVTRNSSFSDLPSIGKMISIAEETKSLPLLDYLIEFLWKKRVSGFHIGDPPDYSTVNLYLKKCKELCNKLIPKPRTRLKYKMKIHDPELYRKSINLYSNIKRVNSWLIYIMHPKKYHVGKRIIRYIARLKGRLPKHAKK